MIYTLTSQAVQYRYIHLTPQPRLKTN